MNKQEQAELEAHAEELERAVLALRESVEGLRYSHERRQAESAASAYEIEAVWLRGFLRRHTEQAANADAPPDDASIKARWS